MRIITKKKIIYLSNPKTASTSIREILDPYSDIQSNQKFPFYHHVSAFELKHYLNQQGVYWEDYFIFTTIRNPWSRAISNYFYAKPDKKFRPFYNKNYDQSSKFYYNFNDWISYVLEYPYTNQHYYFYEDDIYNANITPHILKSPHLLTSIKWFCYEGEKCLVNMIYKMEELNETLIPFLNDNGIKAKKNLKRNSSNFRPNIYHMYNNNTSELIYEAFKAEIEMFDYKF